MKILYTLCLFFIFVGYQVYGVHYDYSFTYECLAKPLSPQYNGGIVVKHAKSADIVAFERQQPFHSFELEKDKLYSFSAWLQVSHGNATIGAMFKTQNGHQIVGWVNAQNGCWSMLKGGFVANASGPADLYFQSKNSQVDIWAESISLQPFTVEEWQSHREDSIETVRKRKVKFQVQYGNGGPVQNATVLIKQRRANFPFGCAINQNILNNQPYQNWFFSRFKYTVFENELKWYANEYSPGKQDYSKPDAMIALAKSRGVSVRGHNVFWDDPTKQPSWVAGLGISDLSSAASKRINSVVTRYRGQLIHWDVLNENLHTNFFESKLGGNIGTGFFQTANRIDGTAIPFLNEYGTIESAGDSAASPAKYLDKIRQIRNGGYSGPLGIGLESHFGSAPNLAYVRSALDQLSSVNLPIWITELDVVSGPNQSSYLDQILRELYAHPGVRGIILWSAWSPRGCYRMCLTDNNFNSLSTGDVVDKFRSQVLLMPRELRLSTDSDGFVEASLLHGEYEVAASHPDSDRISRLQEFEVVESNILETPDVVHLKIQV